MLMHGSEVRDDRIDCELAIRRFKSTKHGDVVAVVSRRFGTAYTYVSQFDSNRIWHLAWRIANSTSAA